MTRQDPVHPGRDLLVAARGAGLKVLGTIVRLVGGLGVSILITRTAGAEAFGHYFVGLTCAQMLAQASTLGLHSSALRFLPVAEHQRAPGWTTGILRACIGIPTGLGLLIGLTTFLLARVLSDSLFDDPGLAPSFRIFSFAIPLTALIISLEASLRGLKRFDRATIGNDVGFQVPKFFLVAVAIAAGAGVAGVALAHLGALATSAILLFAFLRTATVRRSGGTETEYRMRQIWKQALPVYLTRLLRIFNGRLELLLLGVLDLSANVGIYAAALQVGMVGAMLTEALITVTMPLLSSAYYRGGRDALQPLVQTVTRWCLIATLPYYAVVLLFANSILSVFGEDFQAAQSGLILLGALPLLNSAAGIASEALTMTGNAAVNTFNSIAYLTLTLTLDLLLIPSHGIEGAAMAVLSATLILNTLRAVQVRWLFGFWPVNADVLKVIGAVLVAAVVGFFLRDGLAGTGALGELVLGTSVVAVVYTGCLWLLGATAEDRAVLEAVGRRSPFFARLLEYRSHESE